MYRLETLPCLPSVLLSTLAHLQAQDLTLESAEFIELLACDPVVLANLLQELELSDQDLKSPLDLRQMLSVHGADYCRGRLNLLALGQLAHDVTQLDTVLLPLWWRSQLVARFARLLAILSKRFDPQWAYVAGLMFDIGQLAQWQNYGDAYSQLLASAPNDPSLMKKERERLSQDHCQAGARVLHVFPAVLGDTARYHHEPVDAVFGAHPLVVLVNIAVRAVEAHLANSAIEIPDAILQWLGVDLDSLKEMLVQLCDELGDFARSHDLPVWAPELEADNAAQYKADHQALAVALAEDMVLANLQQQDHETLPHALTSVSRALGVSNISLLHMTESSLVLVAGQAKADALTWLNPADAPASAIMLARKSHQPVLLNQADHDLKVIDRQLLSAFAAEQLLLVGAKDKPTYMMVVDAETEVLTGLSMKSRLLSSLLCQLVDCAGVPALESAVPAMDDNYLRELYHEVSNPLTIVSNYVAAMKLKSAESDVISDLDRIGSELRRANELLRGLRQPPAPVQRVAHLGDINELLRTITSLFDDSSFASRGLSLNLDLDESIRSVAIDEGRIRQIITNLLKNAFESLPVGAQVTVRSRNDVYLNDDQFVMLEVCDNGPGLPDTVRNNLFKPKPARENNEGLGLSIVKRLVDEMGAMIACQSEDTGTRFQIYLAK